MSKKIYKYKSNINCSGCVASIQPVLDSLPGVCDWKVDTSDPEKILSIESENLSQEEIIKTVQKSGYKIEPII